MDGATVTPGFASSPWTRRYPRSGVSFARRPTRRATPAGRRGRPGSRRLLVSYLLAASLRRQGRSESLNRIAKLEAHLAYSFRDPANQRRRVRIACTRGTRRPQNKPARRPRPVTGRQSDPG